VREVVGGGGMGGGDELGCGGGGGMSRVGLLCGKGGSGLGFRISQGKVPVHRPGERGKNDLRPKGLGRGRGGKGSESLPAGKEDVTLILKMREQDKQA